jgi:hypothetical protein
MSPHLFGQEFEEIGMTYETRGPLTKIEMAALTARVPCTGDEQLDSIISVSLRVQIASEIMTSLVKIESDLEPKVVAERALEYADALLKLFKSKP